MAARAVEGGAFPASHVKITWYEKDGARHGAEDGHCRRETGGRTSFYMEPDQTEYISNGYLEPLDKPGRLVEDQRLGGAAVWTHDGKTWGLPAKRPIRTSFYYNKDLLAKASEPRLPDNRPADRG